MLAAIDSQSNHQQYSASISLPAEILAEVFPFHLVFNCHLEIIQLGKIWPNICPQIALGDRLDRHFEIVGSASEMNLASIGESTNLMLALKSQRHGMKLKGQAIYASHVNAIFFIGFPWIADLESLAAFDAAVRNCCISDAVIDLNILLDRQAGAIDLTKYMPAQLSQIKDKLLPELLRDRLTGLANRANFMNCLERAIAIASRQEGYLFAVLFLDFDRFKAINDSLGYAIGDRLLAAIACRLEKCLRAGDTIARLGGDEFAILLENIKDINCATKIAERVQSELIEPFNINNRAIFASTSIGIAISTLGYQTAEDVVRDADIAMYRAKVTGKARYQIFDPSMHLHAVTLLQLETDLRGAIEKQEFQVHYQPIVSLNTGKIIGFEALARWYHPEKGLIPPAEFIPIAEETRLILPLGKWILQTACSQMRAWQQQFVSDPPLTISVNISGRQFSQPDFIEQVQQILQQTGLAPESLKLEITESVLMEDSESAIAMLSQLRNLGIQLSMDDFGTGYSSLSYLHRFPINTLKIDRSFVKSVDVNSENWEIIKTVMSLAWNLGMDVVAEGVETPKQLSQLKQLKCESGQGYFFSKPVDSDTATALINSDFCA